MTRIKGQNDQEFFSFLVVLPFFFNKSGCSIQGHGVLEWNTFGVVKKMIRSCKISIATAESILKLEKVKV